MKLTTLRHVAKDPEEYKKMYDSEDDYDFGNVSISVDDSIITLNFTINRFVAETNKALDYLNETVTTTLDITECSDDVAIFDIVLYISNKNLMLFKKSNRSFALDNGFLKIGSIGLDKISGTCIIYLRGIHHNSLSEDDHILDMNESSSKSYFKEHLPHYNETMLNTNNKSRLFNEIDPINSIGYLEAQIDLLTNALLKILDGSSQNEEIIDTLRSTEESSILNYKSISDIKESLLKKKTEFRKHQKKYWKRKSEIKTNGE